MKNKQQVVKYVENWKPVEVSHNMLNNEKITES